MIKSMSLSSFNSAKDFLPAYQEAFEVEIEDLYDSDIGSFEDLKESPELLESIKYSTLAAGKRLRPTLALLTAEAVLNLDGQLPIKSNPGLAAGLAIELVHCGSLIHDDLPCMDDDKMRRGKPTNHIQFGEDIALLAGDFLMSVSAEVLVAKVISKDLADMTLTSTEHLSLAVLKMTQAVNAMIVGQALDMQFTGEANAEKNNERLSHLQRMQEHKTGALLRASVEIPAILSKAKVSQIEGLVKYADNLGRAFQIVDDILDYESSAEILGKSIGKDAEQDKLTYVAFYGLEKSKQIAQDLINEAKAGLDNIGIYSDKLKLVADYVISRKH